MRSFFVIIGLVLVLSPSTRAWGCDLKLTEFRAVLQSTETELETFEQLILKQDNMVDLQTDQVYTISLGTACPGRLTNGIQKTKDDLAGLSARIQSLDARDDSFFECVMGLRDRGSKLLKKFHDANDTTRVLRVQQALKTLTDSDLQSIELSIRIAVSVSKLERLVRQTEINKATCSPDEGGLSAIDF